MKPSQSPRLSSDRGFALIVTISMMILLALLAVGLLSLSTVAVRSSSQGASRAVAQANARLALALAIGDLQKYGGSDTRVTARADILKEENPPITGVWRSWEGENHEQSGPAAGRPISVDYDQEKEERFLSWLVSGEAGQAGDPGNVPDTSSSNDKATLLGKGSVGDGGDRTKLQIHLEPTEVMDEDDDPVGGFAWWVGGENQKARIPTPHDPAPDTGGQWAVKAKSHAVADPKVFRMEDVLADPSLAEKAISLKQADFFAQPDTLPVSSEFFHDLSATSVGLLTNVATGGWKKDLSLFTENRTANSKLPLFRIAPGEDNSCSMATKGNPSAEQSMLYPWASYRGSSSDGPIYQHGPVTSWANLRDYAKAYERVRVGSSGKATISPNSYPIFGDNYGFLHEVRMLPVIARIQWVFSHWAARSTVAGAAPTDLEARLLMTPVITMWNPYSVEMNFNQTPLKFRIPKPLPLALRYKVNDTSNRFFNSLTAGSTNYSRNLADTNKLEYVINSGFTLMPGETKMFSPGSSRPVKASGALLDLRPGYRSGGGHYFEIKDLRNEKISGPASTRLQADARFDTEYLDRYTGVGIYLDMNIRGQNHLAYRMVYTPEVATQVYPEISGMAASTLGEASASPRPFMTTVFGARMASRTHLAAKGFVQSSPLVNYTAMGGKDRVERTISRHYGGTDHPVNSPFDYSFQKVSANDSLLPNESSSTQRGYIVTGFTSAEGLSRCVVAEIPTRPLQSLGELQHWDLRYENPVPPFAFNLIGNSDATPLLPADAVVNSRDARLGVNLQHDDSYCANHLLFDDWFFSSVAPDPSSFGTNGRSMKEVYVDLVNGEAPLPNHAYRAIGEDLGFAAASSANADSLYGDHVASTDAWQNIASRLEVEGMFNVNSTSVAAWRALLGHARDQEIPFISESGAGWNVDLSPPTDYAFSRLSIAGDVEATENGSSGLFPEAAEFSGYRKFDEEQLDELAEEIVKQVRLRGPFLSLAEFVNRQLSSGDLALAGAVQSALNELAKDNSKNPYKVIEGVISRPSVSDPPGSGDAEYQFPDAAIGQSTYGLPGWTRQADVLRALAPTLTARDDTFTVRGYGDARDGNGNIVATAVCEAVVQRSREYVDSTDDADITGLPTSQANLKFGRRLNIISFRWLSPAEV